MAWQRGGDTGASHPALMSTRADPASDGRTINEVAGFVWRLSLQSGAHLTDYVVDMGTVEMIGGPRWPELVRLCLKTGLLTKHKGAFKLIDDPDFINLLSKKEVLRRRQQRNDTRDDGLKLAVILRDGDNCRWCGAEIVWPGVKTARSAELDHLHPDRLGIDPTTVDDLVIACRSCNSARGANRELWDSSHTLRDAPAHPVYGPWSSHFLTRNGYDVSDGQPAPALGADPAPASGVRPAPGVDPAPIRGVRPATGPGDDSPGVAPVSSDGQPAPALGADPAPTGVRPATGLSDDSSDLAPPVVPDPEIPPEIPPESSTSAPTRSDLAGSGRAGPSSAVQERDGLGKEGRRLDTQAASRRPAQVRRRGRRGRRGGDR